MDRKWKVLGVLFVMGACYSGCQFLGGTATGAAATGASYELQARQRMERIQQDLKDGKIDQREYDIRKDEIQKGSLAY